MRSLTIVLALSLSSSLVGCIDDVDQTGATDDPGDLGKGDNDDEGNPTPTPPRDNTGCPVLPGGVSHKPGPQFCPPTNTLNVVPRR
jgi:hypothetical protein